MYTYDCSGRQVAASDGPEQSCLVSGIFHTWVTSQRSGDNSIDQMDRVCLTRALSPELSCPSCTRLISQGCRGNDTPLGHIYTNTLCSQNLSHADSVVSVLEINRNAFPQPNTFFWKTVTWGFITRIQLRYKTLLGCSTLLSSKLDSIGQKYTQWSYHLVQ